MHEHMTSFDFGMKLLVVVVNRLWGFVFFSTSCIQGIGLLVRVHLGGCGTQVL